MTFAAQQELRHHEVTQLVERGAASPGYYPVRDLIEIGTFTAVQDALASGYDDERVDSIQHRSGLRFGQFRSAEGAARQQNPGVVTVQLPDIAAELGLVLARLNGRAKRRVSCLRQSKAVIASAGTDILENRNVHCRVGKSH